MPARRPGGGARARREAGHGQRRQPAGAQYGSIYALRQAAAGASGGRYAQAGSGAQKAGGPRSAMVPGAAAPPPQQASGRWHRRAGPASRWPGGTCPGFGRDGPLAGRATPGSRAPGGRCPAPPSRGKARSCLRCGRSGGRVATGGTCHVMPCRAPGSRPARPAEVRANLPPGHTARAGGHQPARLCAAISELPAGSHEDRPVVVTQRERILVSPRREAAAERCSYVLSRPLSFRFSAVRPGDLLKCWVRTRQG